MKPDVPATQLDAWKAVLNAHAAVTGEVERRLAAAGLPTGPSTVATILVAVVGTLLMGLYARRPIAVAPYMGENAFIAFGLAALGVTWQQRLGAVFVSGIVFLIITLIGARSWLADSISPSMKMLRMSDGSNDSWRPLHDTSIDEFLTLTII